MKKIFEFSKNCSVILLRVEADSDEANAPYVQLTCTESMFIGISEKYWRFCSYMNFYQSENMFIFRTMCPNRASCWKNWTIKHFYSPKFLLELNSLRRMVDLIGKSTNILIFDSVTSGSVAKLLASQKLSGFNLNGQDRDSWINRSIIFHSLHWRSFRASQRRETDHKKHQLFLGGRILWTEPVNILWILTRYHEHSYESGDGWFWNSECAIYTSWLASWYTR